VAWSGQTLYRYSPWAVLSLRGLSGSIREQNGTYCHHKDREYANGGVVMRINTRGAHNIMFGPHQVCLLAGTQCCRVSRRFPSFFSRILAPKPLIGRVTSRPISPEGLERVSTKLCRIRRHCAELHCRIVKLLTSFVCISANGDFWCRNSCARRQRSKWNL
jgi:hypothetical protein